MYIVKSAPERLLVELQQAQLAGALQHYTRSVELVEEPAAARHILCIQLNSNTANTAIDRFCDHVERYYKVTVWNRSYSNKTVTLVYAPTA